MSLEDVMPEVTMQEMRALESQVDADAELQLELVLKAIRDAVLDRKGIITVEVSRPLLFEIREELGRRGFQVRDSRGETAYTSGLTITWLKGW